jgi:hypothetical protein
LRTKNAMTLLALVLAILVAATSCVQSGQVSEEATRNQPNTEDFSGEKDRGEATLELHGDSGTEFSGFCTVGDQEPEEIGGQVPQSFTYELKGDLLRCEISPEGDMQVNLAVGQNVRSVQRISGGTLNLTYENGSISSFVSSSTGPSRQSISSSSQGDSASKASNVSSESRAVSGFSEVELKGVGNLFIQQTGSESLTVEAEEDILPKIRTEVDNNRLIVGPEPDTSIDTTEPINYELRVNDLNALKVSGSGDVEAEDINTDEIAITISGTADVEMSGRVDSQNVEISGSGDYKVEDLESKEVKIDVGGSGSALINVSEELDAEVSGSGSVEYVGDPTVKQDVSGAGEVRKQWFP